jgi:spore maturation protein CgeB
MHVVIFCHSLVSDWNHGNAHFLRGVANELMARRHTVTVYEPRHPWSVTNLVAEHGREPLRAFRRAYPGLSSVRYEIESLDLDAALEEADLVLVHEWNEPMLVRRLGEHRHDVGDSAYRLLFHDTHHRSVTAQHELARFDLRHYDGVLAFGEVIRQRYLALGWSERAWTWHEAAHVRVFRPLEIEQRDGFVWVGNWGDGERSAELHEYVIQPVEDVGVPAAAYGVRFPPEGRAALERAGIRLNGWVPNYRVPEVFARHRVTAHVPRRPYVEALPGIPTIRVFEALACGIPLICARWEDAEGLFRPGVDYLIARDGRTMTRHLRDVLNDDGLATELRARGLETIQARHTCGQRVNELLSIAGEIGCDTRPRAAA